MDMLTLNKAKQYTNNEITTVNQAILSITSGMKSVANTGSNLVFTLSDNSTISVPITGLSDNNYTTIDKNKLASLDSMLLNRFSYDGSLLLFDGQSITNSDNQTYYDYQVGGVGGVLEYTLGYISNVNTIMTASSNNITHCNKVIGFIIETKSQGEIVKIKNQGELINTSWNLISGNVYYLGNGGGITNITPTNGFIQKVGIAKNSTTLLIDLGQPIKLI
jgi:hypothetical protein